MSYQRKCFCGEPLKPQKRGRKPLYCGEKHRRRVEFCRRKLRLRQEWAEEAAGKPWAEEYAGYVKEVQAELEEMGARQ
jgi:hypothetical protein